MSERFARHELIPDWRQDRLGDATVVVVGMGALGNEVARILAMSGAGRLTICDPDTVERSNLSRTVLFREADVRRPKVEAAAAALRELAPGIEVDPRPWPLVHGVGLELATVPKNVPLARIGVAPREILAIRGRDGINWIKLSGVKE